MAATDSSFQYPVKTASSRQARYIFITERVIGNHINRKISQKLLGCKGRIAQWKMSLSQFNTVNIILEHGQLTNAELSTLLGISAPSASAMIERLVKKGIVIRKRNPYDRRKIVVAISPQAKKGISRLNQIVLESIAELIDRVGPETARAWCEVLKQVEKIVQA